MAMVGVPWTRRRWGLPFLTILAPSERYDAAHRRRHKKLTDFARQAILQVRRWLPKRKIVVVADSTPGSSPGVAALDLIAALRRHVCFVTRLRLDAALFEPSPPRPRGQRGRPAKKGRRLPKLADVLKDKKTRWTKLNMPYWYGDERCVLEIVTGTAVWHHPGSEPAPIRWVLVRDPTGVRDPQAFLCTDLDATPVTILGWFVSRWSMETTFQESREHLKRRDAATMVRPRHRQNDPGAVRVVLAVDALGRRSQNRLQPAAAHGGVVSQERAHLQRRHRRRSQTLLGRAEFIHVPARPGLRGNSHRPLEQTHRNALLRRLKCAKSS